MAFYISPIPGERHYVCFASRRADGLPFYIALYKGTPAGYIRFEKERQTGKKALTLALALKPEFRGKDMGTHMIRTATQLILAETTIQRI